MAKAKEISGLDCAADALRWATEVLRVRFDEVIDSRGGALDFSSIEGVHQMRVATRRLRSALHDFAPLMKKKFSRKTRKEIKRIADALGVVRDHDVAILALEKLHEKADTESLKAGLKNFIGERNAARRAARLDLTEAIALSRITDLQERFGAEVDVISSRKSSKQRVSFSAAGGEVVGTSLQNLLALGTSLYHPFEYKELHEMRIAAKRLRYAVELFTACWGEAIAPYAEEIAEMQAALGEAHDCDVWIKSLGERLPHKHSARTADSNHQTALWLLSEFVKKRTKQYRLALKIWRRWQNEQFAERMQLLLKTI